MALKNGDSKNVQVVHRKCIWSVSLVKVNIIWYADDTVIIADRAHDLQNLPNDLEKNVDSQTLAVKINISKTQLMVVGMDDILHT